MKKLKLLLMPAIAISLLVSCRNNSGDNAKRPLIITCTSGTLDLEMYSQLQHSVSYEETFVNIKWKKNNGAWKNKDVLIENKERLLIFSISLKKNESVSFAGDNPEGFSFEKENGFSRMINFSIKKNTNGEFKVKGNVMSLIDSKNYKNLNEMPSKSCFIGLFSKNSGIIDAGDFVLPCKTLTADCYEKMFSECNKLSKAPKLPATTLAKKCYDSMFNQCTSLTVAPELPATALAEKCYFYMFYGCSSLINAPILPAATLVSSCYGEMFKLCEKLNYLKVGFGATSSQDWPTESYCTIDWLEEVQSSGTFLWKGSNEGPIERKASTVPNDWIIQTY